MRFWLDPFSMPIEDNGITLPARETIALGTGLTATDDETNDRTILNVDFADLDFTSPLVTKGGRRKHVTDVDLSGGNYTILPSDEVIHITGGGTTRSIFLPASPTKGDTYQIVDTLGVITGAHNLIVNANGKSLHGSSTVTFTTSRVSIEVTYMGLDPTSATDNWALTHYYSGANPT